MAPVKHGASRRGAVTREYRAWNEMLKRCSSGFHQHQDYAGRGIAVCPQWKDFTVFLRDVGACPGPEWTLDRERNNEGYKPDNVRWATRVTQSRNRRLCSRRKLDIAGAAAIRVLHDAGTSKQQLARQFGVARRTISDVVRWATWV